MDSHLEEVGGGKPLPPHPFIESRAPKVYGLGCVKCGKCKNNSIHTQTPSIAPIRSSRNRPRAINRMYDFLDWLEELKPGSSGIEPEGK